MVNVPDRHSKLAHKFVWPCLEVNQIKPYMYDLLVPCLNTTEALHSDQKKKKPGTKTDLDLVTTDRLYKA